MIKNLTFGGYLLISDFLVEIVKANKINKEMTLILQYSFTHKTSLILRTSTHSAL